MKPTREQLERILIPSVREWYILVILTIGIPILLNFNLILLRLTNGTVLAEPAVQASFTEQIQQFGKGQYLNLASLVIFWTGVGIVAYVVIYSIYSFYSEARSEVVLEGEYVNRGTKQERLRPVLMQVGLVAVVVLLGIVSLNITYPYWLENFGQFVLTIGSQPLDALLKLVISLVGSFVNLYLFKVCIDWIWVLE